MMQTRYVPLRGGPGIVVRPLQHGDVDTVGAVFERLGERSRRARFNGPKPRLTTAELEHLAAVDAKRHVLVAYLEGDDRPVAIARLVRDGSSAEVAFEVVDEHRVDPHRGAPRGRTRGRDHRDHRSRVQSELGRGQPPPPLARAAGDSLRGA
jgi:hypothetical protein